MAMSFVAVYLGIQVPTSTGDEDSRWSIKSDGEIESTYINRRRATAALRVIRFCTRSA